MLMLSLSCARKNSAPIGAWDLAPSRSALLVETRNIGQLSAKIQASEAFKLTQDFPFSAHYLPTGDLAEKIAEELNQAALIAWAPSGSEGYGIWIALSSPQTLNSGSSALDSWFETPGEDQAYQDRAFRVYHGKDPKSSSWYGLQIEGYTIVSNSLLLIEESIRQSIEPLRDSSVEAGLSRLRKASDPSAEAQIYLNMGESDALLGWLLRKKSNRGLNRFGDWVGLDLFFTKDGLRWAGAIVLNVAGRSTPKTESPGKPKIELPASLIAWSIELNEPESELFGAPTGTYSISENGVQPGREIQFAKIEFGRSELFERVGTVQVETLGPDSIFTLDTPIDGSSLGLREGSVQCFFIRDGLAHLCADPAPLRTALADYALEKTTGEELYPLSSAKAHFGLKGGSVWEWLYARAQGAWPARELMPKRFERFKTAVVSVIENKDGDLIQGSLEFGQKTQNAATGAWNLELPAEPVWGPFAVQSTESLRLILVQDSRNNLHALQSDGQLLWSLELDGLLLGKPQAVDAFRNGRIQWVMNSSKKLWMIDRLGRAVENFPVELPEDAAAGCAVFDYDSNRNYRILVPCGNQLLNFGVDGKKTKGWAHKSANSIAGTPQHISYTGKDYLFVPLEGGGAELLDRGGKARSRVKAATGLKKGQTWQLQPGPKPRWMVLDEANQISSISPSGAADRVEAGSELTFYSISEPWTFSGKGAEVMAENGKKTLVLKKRGNRFDEVRWLSSANQTYFLAWDRERSQLVGFDAQGRELEGFPLPVTGGFAALPGPQGLLLICAGPGSLVYAYRFNPG